MAGTRWLLLTMMGLPLAGCDYSIPKPTYTLVQTPAPYRTGSDGVRIDNAGEALDQHGYRVDKKGQQMGIVDVEERTANQASNPMAGFYISSLGTNATGSVMTPIEGARAGAGYGPGSADPSPSGMEAPPPPPKPRP